MAWALEAPAEVVEYELPLAALEAVILEIVGVRVAVVYLGYHVIPEAVHVHAFRDVVVGVACGKVVAGGVFVKAHPVGVVAVAALLEALAYGQVHVVFRVLMLGHEEAVALFLHEVHPPVFAVEVKHRRAVGLIEYIYVSSL